MYIYNLLSEAAELSTDIWVISHFVCFGKSVSGIVPPPPPSGLEAEPVNETAIQLSWNVPDYDVLPVTRYTVVYAAFVSASSNFTKLSLDEKPMSSVVRWAYSALYFVPSLFCIHTKLILSFVHCVPKKTSTFLFFKQLGQKLTDFNDFWCVKSWENLTSIACTWANVHAIDVKFSQDCTHQKSLKSVNFWQSYLKNKKVDVFWDTV